MKKTILLLLILQPYFLFSQLDKLKQGMTEQELKSILPSIHKNKDYKDSSQYHVWVELDTLVYPSIYSTFGFIKGHLESFNIDIATGPDYSPKTDSDYVVLRKLTMAFTSEAEILYGKTYIDTSKMPEKYPGLTEGFYYFATWNIGDKILAIVFEEESNRVAPERYFGVRVDFGDPDY